MHKIQLIKRIALFAFLIKSKIDKTIFAKLDKKQRLESDFRLIMLNNSQSDIHL